ncbi:MAG: dihydroorotase [Candidatus Thermoplasmatota archaeon]|nr:dihydroorotase [Candidatus Thermoplasmatota archaeon]
MYDLVIEGRILADGSPVDAYLCIEGGRIARVCKQPPVSGEYGEFHRQGRSLLLPGVIDTHVHFRDPGMTSKEDFTTGSISAAFGGVTTVIDMPNTRPPTIDLGSLMVKERIASTGSVIDYGLNLAIMGGSDLMAVDTLLKGGANAPAPVGLKAFLGDTTGSLVFGTISSLSKWSPVVENTGAVLALHAEDGSLFEPVKDPEDVKDILLQHSRARPAASEASAIQKATEALGEQAGNAHILHVSTEAGLQAARSSRATVEVTPHHLLMDTKWCERNLEMQAMGKVNPPLRTPSDRAALWGGIADGTVDTIGSDHAPHLIEEKSQGYLSPSGMPGVETMAPLLLSEVSKRRLDMNRFVELCCSSPADRYSLAGKGRIAEGSLADIMVVNLREGRKIKGDGLHSRCGWTPYEGMVGVFPGMVYSRGEPIIDGENLCGKPGRGNNVRA